MFAQAFLDMPFFKTPNRIWCFSQSNPATPRSPWYTEVSKPLITLLLSCSASCITVAFTSKIMKLNLILITSRQLESLDKELQHLSHIKENGDAKVWIKSAILLQWYVLCWLFSPLILFSHVAGIEEEAVPCATHYYTGTTADTGE